LPVRHRAPAGTERARCRQRGDLHGRESVGRAVVRIGEAEVRRGEYIRRVFRQDHRVGGAHRGMIWAGFRHVEGHGLGGRIQIRAAVGRAAVVLHLEGEAGVGAAIAVGGGGEGQIDLALRGEEVAARHCRDQLRPVRRRRH